MSYSFAENWAQEIADVSGDPTFQNCAIEIRNPALLTVTKDIQAGTKSVTGDPVVWSGRARVIGIRRALDIQAGGSANPSGEKTIRVQIPYGSITTRVQRGWQIRVTDGGRNPVLEEYLFIVDSDVNSGNVASYTFEASTVLDNDPGWQ